MGGLHKSADAARSISVLIKAISICGSQSELARRMGGRIKTGHIYYWLKNGIPPEHCPAVEVAVGGAVNRHDFYPEIFASPQVVRGQ